MQHPVVTCCDRWLTTRRRLAACGYSRWPFVGRIPNGLWNLGRGTSIANGSPYPEEYVKNDEEAERNDEHQA